eukprot:8275515-Pyramimonas_sp.AAC.1
MNFQRFAQNSRLGVGPPLGGASGAAPGALRAPVMGVSAPIQEIRANLLKVDVYDVVSTSITSVLPPDFKK